ncbi:condensin-2 complex subunit D3-like [Pieris brassicae]|uniref:condensin-2 complex subunit D3-like n=1 Tax=Pieris brassicae TaxID=7116 RepID=UPI001E660BD1|nr:condensin-2 complex subunit D3-like [Pieris brassicae]XP_045532917.1 condensin-2 complex subunit D3-like [Pieris brassicae]
MQLLEELSNLQLQFLDYDWVQSIYDSEFFEFGDLPSEFQNAIDSSEVNLTFQNVIYAIDDWLSCKDNSDDDASWVTLSNQVNHKKLLALLGYYIDCGNKNIFPTEARNNALWASRLYFKLLSIPGYKAYHIYHSQLFAHTLTCLSYPKTVCENEDNFFNPKQLIRVVNSIIKELNEFVHELKTVIVKLQLSPGDINFEDILSNLIDITGGSIVTKLNIDKIELANLSKVVYEVIDFILCTADGEPDALAIKLLFKAMLPKFIAASLDHKQANNIVRASYVAYSGLILSKYGKTALSSYVMLLQHLTYSLDGLEKAEVRQTRIPLVVGLMSLLPQRSYCTTVKWLLKLTTTAKVPHRQVAMEILAQLLPNDAEKRNSDSGIESRKTSIEDNLEGHDNNKEAVEDTEKDQANTMEEDSQSQSSISEFDIDPSEDISSLINQRRHCVPHGEIVRAIYERISDVSGTLRARAIAILTDLLGSDHDPIIEAMRDISGDGTQCQLAKAATRCSSDERAVVRKAAVLLIHRLLVRNPHPTHYSTLVSLCRDASIVVRGAAVNALADLALNNPTKLSLNAFLTGPMHQLSDPEAKIQEQVINLAQAIIVAPLQKFDPANTDDCLPWSFLAGIVRLNMRKHLQKACMLLVKSSNSINHRLVDLVSTHLGVLSDARDLQSLVLLTSVARHVEYNDVAFLLDYYYKLAGTGPERERDSRLMPLVVELISLWSRFVEDEARRALRDHLIQRIQIDADCRPACVSLAASLDSTDMQWATDLMKVSERRALSGGPIDDWICAADLSLVAPEPPSFALINLYVAALQAPPPEWSESERGACVAGIGRICVRSRDASVVAAPQLAILLQDPAAPLCARLNSLLALTDVCTRYTCIVEPLLKSMCGCLSCDAPAELRRAAARVLTRLLLGGYLRLRTPLYYRFCALLADEDLEVREPAEYYVTSCLTVDVIYHHFVDCVLHYNNENEDKMSFDSRQLIYDVMLQRMSVVQRLNIQCRLAREILTHAANEIEEIRDDEELPAALNAALLDTITLLCGPRMKLPKKPEKSGEADIEDLQERVTTNIVSHKMKRTVAEVLVPAVLRLYARLRTRGGQLATYIVRIATDLHNDYRQEIEELIEDDEELVERVRHFQDTIGLEPSSGNSRNLVTSSVPPDPETPRSQKKRPRPYSHTPRKRKLKI